MYLYKEFHNKGKATVQLLGSGAILNEIIKAADILSSEISGANLVDFKNLLLLEAELPINAEETMQLQRDGFCEFNEAEKLTLTAKGRHLIQLMGLTPKPMKRIKVTGNDAAELIDKIIEELQ